MSRSLITDGILAGVRNRSESPPNGVVAMGVETIIDIVKSDADGIAKEEGYQMPPPVEHATATAGTTITGIIYSVVLNG